MHEVQTATLLAPRHLVWEKKSLDASKIAPDEIFAITQYSTISPGTEVSAYIGLPPLRPGKIYPRVVGYCNVAQVEAVGADVQRCKPGDFILTHQCHQSAFICNEQAILSLVPEHSNLVDVSATYLYHLGYAALLRSGFQVGHRVAVVGLGAIGLGAVAVASAGGGIAAGYSNQDRIAETAMALGARNVSRKIASDESFDIVINTSNKWSDWKLSLELARNGGTVALLGFPGRGEPAPDFNPLDSQFVYDKQLSIIGCGILPNMDTSEQNIRFTVKRNVQYLVEKISRDEISASPIISEVAAVQDIEGLYQRLANREAGLITATLNWKK
jgi:threonine dehydrogenase-like Zn-dependent dehydrogenase